MRLKIISLASFLLLSSTAALGASFNCSKATTTLEKTICSDNSLDKADSRMGELYFSIREHLSSYEENRFIKEHKYWLKQRTVDCKTSDKACLLAIYQQRLENLSNKSSALVSALESLLGNFSMNQTNDCDLKLNIYKEKEKYKYSMSSTKRSARGFIKIYIENDDHVYIYLNGLLADDPPETVSGVFYENQVVIQNYGNAMNEYTQLSECSEKFIELQKI